MIPIVNAHRLPQSRRDSPHSERQPPAIIVRFARIYDRDRLLHAFEHQSRRRQQPTPGRSATPGASPSDSDVSPPGSEAPGTQPSDSDTPGTQPSVREASSGQAPETSPPPVGDTPPTQPAFSRVTIRTDLPPAMKRERGRLATIAYNIRRNNHLSTRITVSGTKVLLQTRKHVKTGEKPGPWSNWKE